MIAYLYLALAFTLNAGANILLKISSVKGIVLSKPLPEALVANWQFIAGVALFAVNVLFYFLALRALPLSIAYPIMVAMSFLLINGYAFVALGENIAPFQIAGYILIIVGLVLVIRFAQ